MIKLEQIDQSPTYCSQHIIILNISNKFEYLYKFVSHQDISVIEKTKEIPKNLTISSLLD